MTRATIAATLFLVALTAAPAEAALCGYNPATKTAAVAITPGTLSTVRVNGTAIQVDGANCGAATTANTDVIDVNGSSDTETLQIDLSGGAFVPGATPEGDGSSEIEWDVDLGENGAIPDVAVLGSPVADHVAVGLVGAEDDSAINLNADETTRDVDVRMSRIVFVRVFGNDGPDVLAATGPEFDEDDLTDLRGGPGADDITAGIVRPGPGNDTIRCPGQAGCFSINYFDAPAGVTVTLKDGTGGDWGGATNDGQGGSDTYVGDPFLISGSNTGGDVFTGTTIPSRWDGNGGADTLNGGTGQDTMRGGAGVDTMHGGGHNDFLYGDAGDDHLFGDGGNDDLAGGLNDDEVSGGAGDDLLREGQADLTGSGSPDPNGADELGGDEGTDTVLYGDPAAFDGEEGRTGAVTVDLDNVDDDGAPGEGDDVHDDVENLIGGLGNDVLTGDGDANVISGNFGADTLRGGGGPDTLLGLGGPFEFEASPTATLVDGADDLDGEGGEDAIDGAAGDDKIEARDGARDTIACGGGSDSGRGDRVDAIAADCEAIELPPETPADPPVVVPPVVTPPVVTPPVVTPPVVVPPAPKVSTLLTLPSSRRCASRRKFTVRVRREIRGTVKRVTIFVNGRRVKSVTGTRIGLPIDLRGLPKGRIRVRLQVQLADGRTATDTRTYRTCATKKRRGQFGRRRG